MIFFKYLNILITIKKIIIKMREKLNYKILIYNFIKKIFAYINIDIKFKKNLLNCFE
jgi:hypothetical protein